jgi:hypothetical protein
LLKNVTSEEIAAFRQNVELVELSGEEHPSVIAEQTGRCASRNPVSSLAARSLLLSTRFSQGG